MISVNNIVKKYKTGISMSVLFLLTGSSAHAQNQGVSFDSLDILYNPLFIVLLMAVIFLAIAIMVLSGTIKATIANNMERDKKKKDGDGSIKNILMLLVLFTCSGTLLAQQPSADVPTVVEKASGSYWGLDAFAFYFMLSLIALEIFIVMRLYALLMQLLGAAERREKALLARLAAKKVKPSIIEKLNASVAVEHEADIMLDHDYDGIRELDNNLPPWWKYGFYISIVWGLIYLVHYHITKTGDLQIAEYQNELAEAEIQKEEYRKRAANLVDENNIKLLTDNASLASGKSIYIANCATCHGDAGQGKVGPNLTDEYWLHGGSLKDVFVSIKYGWPEKGMKAWQADLGAKQMHEVSSYIHSLQGTNPPGAKEKQGEKYIEANASDSTIVKK